MEVRDLFDKLLTSERMEKIADTIASRTIDKILKMRTLPNVHEEEKRPDDTENKDKKENTENEKSTVRDVEEKEASSGLKLKYKSFTESYSIEKVDTRDKTKSKNKENNARHVSKKILRIDNETIENESKYDKTKMEDLVSNKAIDYYNDQSNSRDENHGVSSESDYNNKNVEPKSTKGILGEFKMEKSSKPPHWYLRKEFNHDVERTHSKEHKGILQTKVPRRYSSKETKNKFADDFDEVHELKRSFDKKRTHRTVQNEAMLNNIYNQYRMEGSKIFAYEKSPSYENLEEDDSDSTSVDD